MTKEQCLYNFWSQFGIPAYDETSVPDDASFPYLTYSTITGNMEQVINFTANLWFRGNTWKEASETKEKISKALSKNNILKMDSGYLYLTQGSPFAQRMRDESNDMIKRVYINVQGEYLTEF